jgi:hypothetical protein
MPGNETQRAIPGFPWRRPQHSHLSGDIGVSMRTHRLSALDRVLLQHCEDDFVFLHDLLTHVARGSMYRHVSNLRGAGLLEKRGRTYCTTEQGKRRLVELVSNMDWNIWDRIYLPMQYVPTPQHRAVIELATAAVAARQADNQDDHHPGFVLMGPTLAWKTSGAKFQCHLLGVAPAETIIDLTTETGRSLLVRRDGKGNLAFKRDLLDGQLIVFDDVLEAETSLRPTIHHFLSGRKLIPVDNTLLRIAPVSLFTLNPRPKATLEEQTTFSTAQLRRLVVTNLANVALPDLANMGHRALEAAAKQGPLRLQPPTVDAQTYRPHIVTLVREVLVPQIWPRVDTEMVITLVTGMSGFVPDPERAIQQTVYNYGLTAETLGWARSGWSEAVCRFSLHTPLSTPRHRNQASQEPPPREEDNIILWRHVMEGYRESVLPPFVISDANKARIIAIASQENIPLEHVDHALEVILDNWGQQQRDGRTLDEAYSALELSKHLRERSIPVKDVKIAMRFRQVFREGTYTSEEFQAALDLLPVLREYGLAVQDDRVETVLGLAVRLLNSDRSLTELDAWLTSQPETRSEGQEEPDGAQTDRQ